MLYLLTLSGLLVSKARGFVWKIILLSGSASYIGRRVVLYRGFNVKCGRRERKILVGDDFTARQECTLVVDGGELRIGDNVFLNSRCSINCLNNISMGDNVLLGEGVCIYDHDHEHKAGVNFRDQGFKTEPVKIGNNVWLGTNVVVLKGARIGDNVVVGANTILKGDVPDNVLVVTEGGSRLKIYPLVT